MERILVLNWVDYDMTSEGGTEGLSVSFLSVDRSDKMKNGRLSSAGFPPAKMSIDRHNYEVFAKTVTPFYADVEFGVRVVGGKPMAVIRDCVPVSSVELFKFPSSKS